MKGTPRLHVSMAALLTNSGQSRVANVSMDDRFRKLDNALFGLAIDDCVIGKEAFQYEASDPSIGSCG